MMTIKQLINLQGRCAVITGATGGLGQKMAESIVELGGDLILIDRPGSDFSELQANLEKINPVKVELFYCDLGDDDSRAELTSTLLKREGAMDILINNAAFVGTSGLEGWVTSFEGQTVDTWRRAMDVNLTAVFDLSKSLTPKLKQSGNGSIINIASIYGVNGPDYSLYEGTQMGNPAAYSASKGGLIQLTRWLATTLAPDVRVNAVSPGGVFRNQPESFVEKYNKRTPLGRMATEDDFKGVISFLSSDLSQYITGQNIVVDGGWTVW